MKICFSLKVFVFHKKRYFYWEQNKNKKLQVDSLCWTSQRITKSKMPTSFLRYLWVFKKGRPLYPACTVSLRTPCPWKRRNQWSFKITAPAKHYNDQSRFWVLSENYSAFWRVFFVWNFILKIHFFSWKCISFHKILPKKSFFSIEGCIFNQLGILSFALSFLLCFVMHLERLRSKI